MLLCPNTSRKALNFDTPKAKYDFSSYRIVKKYNLDKPANIPFCRKAISCWGKSPELEHSGYEHQRVRRMTSCQSCHLAAAVAERCSS